ncbi:MAG: DUF2804 domain-containing protein [Oscillospiraceae bacterium]|jgi:hypothetical protein|nr:DUF2804 domain-containing protein [Oscillospiraceae bacterium]
MNQQTQRRYSSQKEIVGETKLLGKRGRLAVSGWSRSPVFNYNRLDVPSLRRAMRLKEWDYYLFGDDRYQIALTIADNGYMGLISASFIDLEKGFDITKSKMAAFPMGSFDMPFSSDNGDIVYRSKKVSLNFIKGNKTRKVSMRWINFDDSKELYADVTFVQNDEDSMAIAVPFEGKAAKAGKFYYNHKINCMPVFGKVKLGAEEFNFSENTTFGCLDWGRGVWPYDNNWVWCSASGLYKGERFGFNLGTGFGDRAQCGENIFYYKGKGYKVGELQIDVPKGNYKQGEWTFRGEDGLIDLRMIPSYERLADISVLGLLKSEQHQVFGKYYGTVVLIEDDGSETTVTLDGLTGFSEDVINKW